MKFTFKNSGILRKFLITFLIISVSPLLIFSVYTLITISSTGRQIESQLMKNIDDKTKETIEFQAILIANSIEKFLKQREGDLFSLLKVTPTSDNYILFSKQHESEIWTRAGTNENPFELHIMVPIYKEIAFVDKNGNELVKIREGKIVPKKNLRNVSDPKNTTYKSEIYFNETIKLNENEIYVSHLNGFHINKLEQLGSAKKVEDAIEGKKFEGVVRFSAPVYNNNKITGVVVLGLDHQHLMDLTQHILPNKKTFIVFPSYSSGDYAFMFDDEGWIITHPKFWDIRGFDKRGNLVPAYSENTPKSKIDSGIIPFNLDKAGFIHPNYPYVSSHVRQKQSGTVTTINVGGTKKIMAYAPIFYNRGVYKKYGIFGGITLGAELEKFHTPALTIASELKNTVKFLSVNISWFILFTLLISGIISLLLSKSLSKPIVEITDGARLMAKGELDKKIDIDRKDEIGVLASSFNYMTEELKKNKKELIASLDELKISKNEIEYYAKDLEYQIKILKSIQQISNVLGTTFEVNEVLKNILKNCVNSIGFDRAILYLIDKNNKYLKYSEMFGFTVDEEKLVRKSKYNLNHFDSIETRVVKTGNIAFIKDFDNYKEATDLDRKIRKAAKSKSFVFVPLKVKEKIIGIMGADKLRTNEKITEIDISSLQILANQAARVIENTLLYQEIIEQRNFVEDVLRYMSNGLITTNENGNITSINKAAIEILKLNEFNIIGKNIELIFNDHKKLLDNIIDKVSKKGYYHGFDISVKINNEIKYFNINVTLIKSGDNKVNGSVIVLQDITNKKHIDDHLQRIDRLASLGKFAAGIAHEIRNPLTGLSLFLDDLHDSLPSKGGLPKIIEQALNEVSRLENLVKEILAYAAPPKGSFIMGDINSVIESILPFIKIQCEKNKVTFSTQLNKKIKSFYFDATKIRQALINFMLNAIQSMPKGGTLKIKTNFTSKDKTSDSVRIIISDTGCGINKEDLEKIYDPFFTNRKSGTGLGLSISHSIISEHKGTIAVKSKINEGTKFTITLPLNGK